VAVLDANVLFPFTLRDTLLRIAAAGVFQLRWSEQILDEMERNLVGMGFMSPENGARLRRIMVNYFPESSVSNYQTFLSGLHNDPKDRHVVAAALKSHAGVIVTANLRDFVPLPEGLVAMSPDQFLCDLFESEAEKVIAILKEQAMDLKNPPISLHDLISRLEKVAPDFVGRVRCRVESSPQS
jgi:predicted nucleic acid-binding protein